MLKALALALAAKLLFGGSIKTPHGRRFITLCQRLLAPLAEVPSLISCLMAVAFAFDVVVVIAFAVVFCCHFFFLSRPLSSGGVAPYFVVGRDDDVIRLVAVAC